MIQGSKCAKYLSPGTSKGRRVHMQLFVDIEVVGCKEEESKPYRTDQEVLHCVDNETLSVLSHIFRLAKDYTSTTN